MVELIAAIVTTYVLCAAAIMWARRKAARDRAEAMGQGRGRVLVGGERR